VKRFMVYFDLFSADLSLDQWLVQKEKTKDFVQMKDLCEILRAVVQGLAWLHGHGLCHLDLKPENIMRFLCTWKIIDLDGCLPKDGTARVCKDAFSPLYACPELAAFALHAEDNKGPVPSEAMDVWSLGVVLLDVLAHCAAFQETKSGFDSVALFDEESLPCEEWYQWVSDPWPICIPTLITRPESSVALLSECPALEELLKSLLAKDPQSRTAVKTLLRHPFVLNGAATKEATSPNRVTVEQAFQSASVDEFTWKHMSEVLSKLGMPDKDIMQILQLCDPQKLGRIHYSTLLDFAFN